MDEQTKSRMTTTRRKKTRDEMNWLKCSLFERDVIMSWMKDELLHYGWMNGFKWIERYL